MDFGSTFLAILTGLGLSVACGFRVFIPPLIVSIAAQTGNLELAESFSWLGEWPTLIALGIATVCDFIGHEIPAVDDMLNVVEAPLTAIAGTVLSASMFTDMDPLLQWGLAAIAGGGTAETVHLSRSFLKGGLNLATFGLSTPLVSIAEDGAAVVIPILALLAPWFVLFIFLVLFGMTAFAIKKWIVKRRRQSAQTPHSL